MRRYKFSIYNLIVAIIIVAWGLTDPQYDDGSFGAIYFFVLPFCAFVFVGAGELLNLISTAIPPTIKMALAFTVGMLFSLFIDISLRRLKKRIFYGK